MDIRFFIVSAPFVIAFFYTLFWLNKWGAFDYTNMKNKTMKEDKDFSSLNGESQIENIFLSKN